MFLKPLLERNPSFIEAAIELHRAGQLPANCYVLDLDAVRDNAATLQAEADRLGLEMFAMTKQIGRNPAALAALRAAGMNRAVAVDMACARVIHREGTELAHIGHLVQVPRAEANGAAAMKPANWTVFNLEKAREAGAAAHAVGSTQDLLARVKAPGDAFYPGQEGGFDADQIEPVAEAIDALPGARFAGITTFPALRYDPAAQEVLPTPNLKTLAAAAARLDTSMRVNAPGTTSTAMLKTLADHGATQVEPGHALTGTTPLHAIRDLPEVPAALYLTEVSHHDCGRAYCFGGGMYVDPVFPPYPIKALVNGDLLDAQLPPAELIDYYGQLLPGERATPAVGDTVIFGFRIQAFVTRAYVSAIAGVRDGRPRVAGVWTSGGETTSWPA
jgi:predicted amino acid racemase